MDTASPDPSAASPYPLAAGEQVRILPVGGVPIFAQLRGSMPRRVFLHGMGSDLRSWDSLYGALDDGADALRYDLRGFGCSPYDPCVPFVHADDLLAVLDAIEVERCALVGVSMGGGVAINFALDHADRVDRLVLISPHIIGWEWSDAWRALWRPIALAARSGSMDQARQLWWQHPLFASTRDGAQAQRLYQSIMRYHGKHWLHDPHLSMLPDIERLHRLEMPTLLLTGGCDFEDFRLMAQILQVSVEGLIRRDDPNRGHLLHLEDPQTCTREMLAFLSAG